jgi:hypothetical protein
LYNQVHGGSFLLAHLFKGQLQHERYEADGPPLEIESSRQRPVAADATEYRRQGSHRRFNWVKKGTHVYTKNNYSNTIHTNATHALYRTFCKLNYVGSSGERPYKPIPTSLPTIYSRQASL